MRRIRRPGQRRRLRRPQAARRQRLKVMVNLAQPAIAQHAPSAQHDRAPRVSRHQIQMMRHHHHRAPRRVQTTRQVQDRPRPRRVLPRRRLVEDQHLRLQHQHRRHHHARPVSLAQGEGMRLAQRGQPQLLQRRIDPPRLVRLAQAGPHPQRKPHLRLHRGIEQLPVRILRHVAYAPRDLLRRQGRQGHAVEHHLPPSRPKQTEQMLQQRAFPRAVLPDQQSVVAPKHIQRHVAQSLEASRINVAHVTKRQNRPPARRRLHRARIDRSQPRPRQLAQPRLALRQGYRNPPERMPLLRQFVKHRGDFGRPHPLPRTRLDIAIDRARRPVRHHAPARQQHDPIARRRHLLRRVPGHDKRRAPLRAHPRHQPENLRRALRIKLRGRLVQHHHPGPQGQRARKRQPLLLPARKRVRRAFAQPLQSRRRQSLAHPRPNLFRRQRQVLQRERHLRLHRGGHQLRLRILKNQPHTPGQRMDRALRRIQSSDTHRAEEPPAVKLRHDAQAGQRQRRLARAGRPREPHDFAGRHA